MFEKILAVDLDGTIYSRVNGFNQADIEVLKQLPEKGFVRVIATGRTLKSAQRVLSSEFPIDYLVFSSGAGVFDWKQQKLVRSTHLNHSQANDIIGFLRRNNFV